MREGAEKLDMKRFTTGPGAATVASGRKCNFF